MRELIYNHGPKRKKNKNKENGRKGKLKNDVSIVGRSVVSALLPGAPSSVSQNTKQKMKKQKQKQKIVRKSERTSLFLSPLLRSLARSLRTFSLSYKQIYKF